MWLLFYFTPFDVISKRLENKANLICIKINNFYYIFTTNKLRNFAAELKSAKKSNSSVSFVQCIGYKHFLSWKIHCLKVLNAKFDSFNNFILNSKKG